MKKLLAMTPRLKTTNFGRAMKFYVGALGMKPDVLWPKSSPTFCILERDGIQIGFSKSTSSSPIDIYIEVQDAAGWHRAVKRKVKIEWGPEVYSYGRREFAFRDPDGNLVILTERTTDPATCIVEK